MAPLAKKLNKRRQTKFITRYVKSVGMSSKGKTVSPSSWLWFIKGTPPTSNLAQRKLQRMRMRQGAYEDDKPMGMRQDMKFNLTHAEFTLPRGHVIFC